MKRKSKNPEKCDEICENCMNRFSCRKRSLIGFEKLAFGSTADAFKLMMSDGNLDLSGLNLFNVAEIKKPKDGAMELKFFDRLKALEQLGVNVPQSDGSAVTFYKALNECAEKLEVNKDDS